MPDNKIILGLVGEIASGKDAMASYLKEKYNSKTMSFSAPIRKILDIIHLEQSRENMVWLATDIRSRFGQDIWSKVISLDCKKNPNKLIVLPNIRLWEDTQYLKENGDFFLIHIDAKAEIRYERLTKRGQNPDDKTKTWEQFLKEAEMPTEFPIKEVAKKATYRIENNGSYEVFYKQIDELMEKISS